MGIVLMCFIHAADLLHLNFANGFLDCEFHLLEPRPGISMPSTESPKDYS